MNPKPFDGLWFEQVIQQSISPKIEGLKILLVPLGNSNNAVVVTVPQSNTIHQVKAGLYYRRRNFRNDIMADYEIREAMIRSRTPELNVLPVFPRSIHPEQTLVQSTNGGRSDRIELDFIVFNLSSQPAEYAVLIIAFDLDIQIVGTLRQLHDLGLETTEHLTLHKYALNLGFPDSPPLFKENPESAGTLAISVSEPSQLRSYALRTEIRTPGFSQRRSWVLVQQPPALYLREVSSS